MCWNLCMSPLGCKHKSCSVLSKIIFLKYFCLFCITHIRFFSAVSSDGTKPLSSFLIIESFHIILGCHLQFFFLKSLLTHSQHLVFSYLYELFFQIHNRNYVFSAADFFLPLNHVWCLVPPWQRGKSDIFPLNKLPWNKFLYLFSFFYLHFTSHTLFL